MSIFSAKRFLVIGIGTVLAVILFGAPASVSLAQRSTWENNISMGNSNYRRLSKQGLQPASCRQFCLQDRNCRAWTYVRSHRTSDRVPVCYAHRYVKPRVAESCCISGVVSRGRVEPRPRPRPRPGPSYGRSTWENDVSRGSSSYRRLSKQGLQPASCRQFCLDNPNCRAWTYVRSHRTSDRVPVCYAHRYVKPPVAESCCISGVVSRGRVEPRPRPRPRPGPSYGRSSWEPNISMGRSNYRRLSKQGLQPASCRDFCLQDRNCRAWTYMRPYATRSGVPVCYAHRYLKPRRREDCCISGVVGRARPGPGPRPGFRTHTFNVPRINGAVVDWCSTWAANCGWGGATRFCRRQGFARAMRWQIYRPGRTWVMGSRRFCDGGVCKGFRYVTCRR